MNVYYILTEPVVPENVGAAARAIKTMGFNNLRLVNTKAHLDERASWLAHASNDVLENAELFDSLKDAIAGIDLVIATSAKKRRVKEDYFDCHQLPDMIRAKGNAVGSVAIVFGREESGLTNEEMKLCHLVSSVPLHQPYPSLNLGQAVMIYAYTLSTLVQEETIKEVETGKDAELKALQEKTAQILSATKLGEKPSLYNRIFERLNMLGNKDIHLLHSICNHILEDIMENKQDKEV